ncbi:MAG: hypothetical protein FJ194_09520 [Gammaproteobacteria bacterium]|nr:hypothetical protein [Gammaproteobacteria bacterium]
MTYEEIHPAPNAAGGRVMALPAAAFITMALFHAMTALIRGNDVEIVESAPTLRIDWAPELEDEMPLVKERTPKLEPVERPPVSKRGNHN